MPTDEQSHPIESHDQHVFLAAGAGSGKTRVLVHRYLHFLRAHKWDPALPARMLAITFTEKAALEMQERVLRELRELSAKADDEFAARRRLLEREMEAAPISTIHGFCSRLLRENAVEAGLDPLFRVPDEVELHALREGLLDRLFAEADEDLLLLTGELGLDRLREGLSAFRDLHRSLGLDPGALDPAVELAEQEKDAREALRVLLDEELRALPSRIEALCAHFAGGEHPKEKGRMQIAEATATLRGGEPGAATLDLALVAMNRIPQKLDDGERFKKTWDRLRKEMREIMARYGELDHPGAPERPRGLRRAALALAARYERMLGVEMRARSWLDFEDLQLEALRLLETRSDLRTRLREQYRQIFVDEFQDTNPLQLRLVRALMPEDEPSGERALFLVGDHRQSIYAFRNADLDVFLREGERMESRGEKRELRHNWRSRARLIDFFNEIFPQDEFPPMDSRDEDGAEPRVILQMTARDEKPLAEARREMAEGLADTLWRARESGLEVRDRDTGEMRAIEWSDMALLLRSGTLMGTLARALADRGIPYEAAGGRDYFLRQELRDLEDLVAALDDPFHRLKLARALRGDIIGLSSADLLALLPPREGGRKVERDGGQLLDVLLGEPPEALSEDGRRRLAIFQKLHGEFRRRLHRESLSELIPALVRASGFEIQAATGPWGLKVQRNLRQLADLVGELEANGPLGVRDFLGYMERVRELSPRREEAWVPEEGEKTLRILTVHSAKGLEFPLVVLADLDRDISGRQHGGSLASLRAGGPRKARALLGLRWKGPADENVPDLVYRWIQREKARRDAAELRRLFYVACTRARDWLLLAGVSKERCEIAEPPENPADSFLDVLRAGLAGPVEKKLCRVTWTGDGEAPELGPGLPRAAAAAPAPVGEPAWDLLLEPPPDPGRPELAVTSLSSLGACPLRWMLEKRLGLRGRGRSLHAEEEAPRERYGGAEFGTVVHNILERWDFRAEPGAAFEAACPPGLDPGQREASRKLLLDFFAAGGPWVERLARAENLRREESFTLELENLVLVGQVDLVLEAEGQRFLVDWKSDAVDAEAAKERRHHYEMQMALYALALEKAGRPADRAFLAFLRPARFLEVKIEAQNLRWAAARAEKLGALAREMSRSEAPAPPQDPPCRGCPWRATHCPASYRDR